MLSYTELSEAQKRLVQAMNQGNELQWHKDLGIFQLHFKDGSTKTVKAATADSLLNRRYIDKVFIDDKVEVYSINVCDGWYNKIPIEGGK